MMLLNVRSAVLLVVMLTITAVHSAPPKKFPFVKARASEPEPAADSSEVADSTESNSSDEKEETLEQTQAKAAQYAYDTSVNDTINDHTIMRQEERNGLSLKGMYSYSDGYFRRSVHYVADDKGYRVVKETNVPIGNGPQIDPNGKADVSSSLTGSYSITADDIAKPKRSASVKESEEADSPSSSGEDDTEPRADSESDESE